MKILSLEIQNYKCLRNLRLPSCSAFHTFIGRNSSGKSSIFEACKLITHFGSKLSKSLVEEKVFGGITMPFDEKTITVRLEFDVPITERKNYLEYYFNFTPESVQKMLATRFLERILLTISLRVSGDAVTNTLDGVVALSEMRIIDSHGNFKKIVYEIMPRSGEIELTPVEHAETKINVADPGSYLETLTNNPKARWDFGRFIGWQHVFQVRIIRDFISRLNFVEAVRESKKRVAAGYAKDISQVGERGSELVNLMDTMYTNDNERFMEVTETCKRIFPDITNIHPERLPDNQVRIVVKKKNIPHDIDLAQEGSGLDQVFIIIWLIATSQEGSIWFLDEPELHLHPGAQKLLYDFLKDESKRNKQIFVATHSMVFIHNSELSEVSLLVDHHGETGLVLLEELVTAEEANTKLGLDKIRPHVYKSLGYDPTLALEPRTVVMVEGPVDESVLRSFSKILGSPVNPRATEFIIVGNKAAVKSFSPILTYALSGKKCIIVLDNDKESPQDIKKKILQMESEYREKLRLDYPILGDENFYLFPEHIYSIEYYLLEAQAICRSFSNKDETKVQTIADEIQDALRNPRPGKFRPKSFLQKLCNKHFGSYNERETPIKIASHLSAEHLKRYSEIVDLIKIIAS